MPFLDYKGTWLHKGILPIIPVDAVLSPKSGLTPDKLGKIPGRYTPDGWVGFGDFTKHVTQSRELETFEGYYEKSGTFQPPQSASSAQSSWRSTMIARTPSLHRSLKSASTSGRAARSSASARTAESASMPSG